MPTKLSSVLIEKIQNTAQNISKNLSVQLNTVNYVTSKYKLLTPENRMEIWRRFSPVNIHKLNQLKNQKLLKRIKFDRNLGYVLGCCFGDASIWKPSPTARNGAVQLKTTNFSFAKKFSDVLREITGRETRFHERVYKIKKTPTKQYRNVKFYETFLNSVYFADFLTKSFSLKKLKKKQKIDLNQFLSYSDDFCLGFLQGIFDSDGGIYIVKRKNRPSYRITIFLYSSSKNILFSIKELLQNFGINSTSALSYQNNSNKIAYRLAIYKVADIVKFHRLIGFEVDYKKERLERAVRLLSHVNV